MPEEESLFEKVLHALGECDHFSAVLVVVIYWKDVAFKNSF
jgi:hypothetical protein